MPLEYSETALEAFIASNLGPEAMNRYRPRIDRLITLYKQYGILRYWLDANAAEVGSKDYKEQVTALNALMQNIRYLEEDLELYKEKKKEVSSNPLMARLKKEEVKLD
jgi:hypothetical protein